MGAHPLEIVPDMTGADSLRVLIEGSPDGFLVHDVAGHILDVNERFCRDLGYSRAELIGLTIDEISCGRSPAANARLWVAAVPGTAATVSQIAVRKDRTTYPAEVRLTCQMVAGRKLFMAFARSLGRPAPPRLGALELSARERAREAQSVYGKLRAVMDSADDVIAFQDRLGRCLMLNRSAEALAGLPRGEILGRNAIEIFGDEIGTRLREKEEEVLSTGACSVTEEVFPVDGGERIFLITRSPHRNERDEIDGLVSIARDVTDLRERARLAEERLKQANLSLEEEKLALSQRTVELGRQAGEDALTGIANRRRFDEALERACLHAARMRQPLALAMIDVDFFKLYNDRYGHVQGDATLKRVADILAGAVRRPYDLAARYGGEEFVLLLPGSDQPRRVLEDIATELARARLPHAASPVSPFVTMSCGCVVVADPAAVAPADIIGESDKALYRAKQEGRDRIVVTRF
ncbi:GGDEF domain-containing protein [Sphingomonas kyeonggiensis]|uniref:diguanylate cyclase n=1 Tax=Sphingomonas kyeonggiensis TaxID=1268553 RepID=A0A7W6NY73_9SPHN|nr:diguanylate cyclase [Sphingomonas kyeonggiensis]MBB4099294.1 diguanylate cyclase (GGDEF)-like protein/PAS domain S-box-containing protein [Sphingomonas kyeonggiensis]